MPTLDVLEIEELLAAVEARLAADATLAAAPLSGRIYHDIAPRAAVYPLVVLAGVSAVDQRTMTGTHVYADCLFQVTVRDKGGTLKARIKPLAEAVCAALDGATIANGAVYVVKIRRTRVVQRGPDREGDVVYPQIVQEFATEALPN